jgi:hypothetical protein
MDARRPLRPLSAPVRRSLNNKASFERQQAGQQAVKREAGINDRSRQMPNETHLKRLISDAVFEAHNTHGRQAAGDRLFISREDSRIIAGAVFDAFEAGECPAY